MNRPPFGLPEEEVLAEQNPEVYQECSHNAEPVCADARKERQVNRKQDDDGELYRDAEERGRDHQEEEADEERTQEHTSSDVRGHGLKEPVNYPRRINADRHLVVPPHNERDNDKEREPVPERPHSKRELRGYPDSLEEVARRRDDVINVLYPCGLAEPATDDAEGISEDVSLARSNSTRTRW